MNVTLMFLDAYLSVKYVPRAIMVGTNESTSRKPVINSS